MESFKEQEELIKKQFPDSDILAFIPYTRSLPAAGLNEKSVLENMDTETLNIFENLLKSVEEKVTA